MEYNQKSYFILALSFLKSYFIVLDFYIIVYTQYDLKNKYITNTDFKVNRLAA